MRPLEESLMHASTSPELGEGQAAVTSETIASSSCDLTSRVALCFMVEVTLQ